MHVHIDLIFSLTMGLLGHNSIASQGVIKWKKRNKTRDRCRIHYQRLISRNSWLTRLKSTILVKVSNKTIESERKNKKYSRKEPSRDPVPGPHVCRIISFLTYTGHGALKGRRGGTGLEPFCLFQHLLHLSTGTARPSHHFVESGECLK